MSDLVQVGVRIPRLTKRRFKIVTTRQGDSIQSVMENAITQYLIKHETPEQGSQVEASK